MSKLWEHVFSEMYDPLLWIAERAGMARRRNLLAQASGRVLEGETDALDMATASPNVARPADPARWMHARVARSPMVHAFLATREGPGRAVAIQRRSLITAFCMYGDVVAASREP